MQEILWAAALDSHNLCCFCSSCRSHSV